MSISSMESNDFGLSQATTDWLGILRPGKEPSSKMSLDKRIAIVLACQMLMFDVGDVSSFFSTKVKENWAEIRYKHPKALKTIPDLVKKKNLIKNFRTKISKVYKQCVQAQSMMKEKIGAMRLEQVELVSALENPTVKMLEADRSLPSQEVLVSKGSELKKQYQVLEIKLIVLNFFLTKIWDKQQEKISQLNFLYRFQKSLSFKILVLKECKKMTNKKNLLISPERTADYKQASVDFTPVFLKEHKKWKSHC